MLREQIEAWQRMCLIDRRIAFDPETGLPYIIEVRKDHETGTVMWGSTPK